MSNSKQIVSTRECPFTIVTHSVTVNMKRVYHTCLLYITDMYTVTTAVPTNDTCNVLQRLL